MSNDGLERVALVDGSGLAYRSFHALPEAMSTPKGEPTNAIYGFAKAFRKIFAGRRVSHMAVVFDAPGGTFRHAADATYKAHRPPMPPRLQDQLPGIEALVRAHGVPVLKVQGVEADDVIATLAVQARDRGQEVWIVSPDKDFFQLIDDHIRQLDPRTDVLLDADRIRRKYGVLPERFLDWLALVGDKVDNIPGVPGIGRKTASELLDTADLDTLLADPPEGRGGKALAKHADAARRSRDLARLHTDVPLAELLPGGLDDLAIDEPEPAALNRVYQRFAFHSLLVAEDIPSPDDDRFEYFVADTLEMVAGALEHETQGSEPTALQILVEPRTQELVGYAICPRRKRAVYVPVTGPSGLGRQALELASTWLASDRPKVLHRCKLAHRALGERGLVLRGVVGDTALGSYLLDPTRHIPHQLDQVARDQLHTGLQTRDTLTGKGRDRVLLTQVPVDRVGAFACHQADAIGAIWSVMAPSLDREAQRRELDEVDIPLARVLADMELRGIAADHDLLLDLEKRFLAERRQLDRDITELVGHKVNIRSNKQLGSLLFDELELPVQGRTKTGYKTDATVLARLEGRHPVIPLVQRHKVLDTLIHTYTKAFRASIHDDGRMHPLYVATNSASGRVLMTEPDLQRTPVATAESAEVRQAITAGEGLLLVRADWSQLELRLLAHLSGDEALQHAFRTDDDVHRRTAAILYDVPTDQVTSEQRTTGKVVNFATIYGQGASALAEQLGISAAEARRFIDAFFDAYPGVAAWRDATIVDAHARGFVTTFAGRRRYMTELTHRDRAHQSYGERAALNTPIQGSGADLCKRALLRADARLPDGAGLVLQVHDELLVECRPEQVDEVAAVLREAMEQIPGLAVPLPVSVGVGRTWWEAHAS